MRASIYVRLSRETDATTSPERQLAECQAYLDGRGWQLEAVHQDIDVSAFSGVRRPGLEAALDNMEHIDALVFYRLDRLARSVIDFHTIMQRAEANEVALISVSESLDFSSPMGRAMATIIATFAQLESDTIATRVKAAQAHLPHVGRWRGGRRPFGFQPMDAPDGRGKVLTIDETEASAIRSAAEELLQGRPALQVAEQWNEDGLKTPLGHRWSAKAIRQVFGRRSLMGEAVLNGSPVLDDEGSPSLLSDPILDPATWARVQSALGESSYRRPERSNSAHGGLLTGTLYCGECGLKMVGTVTRGRLRYRCPYKSRGTECVGVTVMADPIEEFVEQQLLEAVGEFPIAVPTNVPTVETGAERQLLLERLAAIEEDYYVHELFRDDGGEDRFRSLRSRIQLRLDELKRQDISVGGAAWEWGDITVAEAWGNDRQKRAEIVRTYLGRIEVSKADGPGTFDSGRVLIVGSDLVQLDGDSGPGEP